MIDTISINPILSFSITSYNIFCKDYSTFTILISYWIFLSNNILFHLAAFYLMSLSFNFRMNYLIEYCLFNIFWCVALINIVLFLWRDYDISKEQRLVKYLFLVIFQLKGADFMNTLYVDIDESTQNNQVYAMNFNQDIFNITSLTILIDVIILS